MSKSDRPGSEGRLSTSIDAVEIMGSWRVRSHYLVIVQDFVFSVLRLTKQNEESHQLLASSKGIQELWM